MFPSNHSKLALVMGVVLFKKIWDKCILRKILSICIFRCVSLWAQKSLFLSRSDDLPETSAHFPLSCCFFQPSFTETFFSPELLLPKNDQLKGVSQHIHLSSAVLSSSAKNDKPIDFKFLLIGMNPLSWNLKWNSLGPWKRTWQLQSCDYSLIFSLLNPLSWLKSLILKSKQTKQINNRR